MASFPGVQTGAPTVHSSSMDTASSSTLGGLGQGLTSLHQPVQDAIVPPAHLHINRRISENPSCLREPKGIQSANTDFSKVLTPFPGLLALPRAVQGLPLLPSQSASSFWQADGSFSCDWTALKTGEAFCSTVKSVCAFCLARALGGPARLTSALLKRLRAGAKLAIEDEVARLIKAVKSFTGASTRQESNCQYEAGAEATQQLMKHPALQAVAFLSVHERRLAVFEIWLDRWQVLSGSYQCTCGSAEAADEGLTRIASANPIRTSTPGKGADTKVAIENLRAQVARLRKEAREAQRDEESAVAEAQEMSVHLVAKQQQLLLGIERVKALEKIRTDPTVSLMQRAQQRQTSAGTVESIIASQKESFSFIAEKCSKLANLARVMQQQQFPHLQKGGFLRLSWEASQTMPNAREEDGGVGLMGGLRGIQTPHVSLHSPRSQHAHISCCASPIKLAHRPAAPPTREITAGHKIGEEAAGSPNRREPTASPPPTGRDILGLAEAESSKRRRGVEEPDSVRRRRAHPLGGVNTDLDMDGEAAWDPPGRKCRIDPAQDAIWVDSFLRRRPEVLQQ